MNQRDRLKRSLCLIRLVALSIILTVVQLSPASANSSQCSTLFYHRSFDESKFALRSTSDGWGWTAMELFSSGKKIAFIDFRPTDSSEVTIGLLHVDETYRRKGISKFLLGKVVKRVGRSRTFHTQLELDNQTIFSEAYNQSLDPTSPNFAPHLSEQERFLHALKATPAYKIRRELGIHKILQLEVEDCRPTQCAIPKVKFDSTGE